MYRLYDKCRGALIRVFHYCKDKDFIYLIPFVLLSLKVRLQYFYFLKSPGQSFPEAADSTWYLEYARALIAGKRIGTSMDDLMYMGYNFLLALLIAIFENPITIIFIQAVTAGLSVILVFKIARMLFNRTTAIIASYFYCYHTWGITLWSMYVLSDSFFISLLLLTVYLLLKSMESAKKLYKILFVASSLYLFVFKPTGIVAVFFILVYVLINVPKQSLVGFIVKYRVALVSVAAAVSVAGLLLLLGGKLDPLVSSMQFNIKKVLYNIYAKGWIYDMPSPHDHPFKADYNINIMNSLTISFIVNNWDHISVLYAKRMVAFLGRWVWTTDLSSTGGIVAFAKNMIPTFLFLTGTVVAIVSGVFRRTAVVWLLVLAVFMFCIVFFIDGMYRYRTPSIPFTVIIVAYGAERIIHFAIVLVKAAYIRLPALLRKRDDRTSYSSGV
ncbi:glycosyltransferase family 39 protein [Paenibacillus mesophilus]|uniref:glycosyltransferase family 39 protein n=1 Tax=Paenibacillus mesophilus TaxID=2582849 RepID=UPI0013050E2E|nr:glycosyltransferase family 39 protein [Paenibacillus mesophilus]